MVIIITSFLFCLYVVWAAIILYGYTKPVETRLRPAKEEWQQEGVSIVIAFKDERENLPNLLEGLLAQDYSNHLLELIFINDHSLDDGEAYIEQILSALSVQYVILELKQEKGKKAAVQLGVERASHEHILFSDADCTMSPSWVKTMLGIHIQEEATMTLGPVEIHSDRSILGSLQRIEFSSLIAATMAMANLKHPIMANGANLLIRKSIFKEINPYTNNRSISSGDDVFLLHELKKKRVGVRRIVFANDKKALIKANGARSIMEFINQRTRWAGKSKHYFDLDSILIGTLIFLINLALLAMIVLTVCSKVELNKLFFFFGIKLLVDYILLKVGPDWLPKKKLLFYVFLLSLIYPFYSIGIALLSLLYKPKWKGRKTSIS